MGAKSDIEWTDASWTPIRARYWEIQDDGSGKERIGWHCEHASDGCRFCYAETMNRRLGTGMDFKPGNLYREEHKGYHNGEVKLFLDEYMLRAPLRWKKPRMIFVCSMTDLFADFVPDEWIVKVLDVIRRTSYDGGSSCGSIKGEHTYQILTKRAARMASFMPRLRFDPRDDRGLYLSDDGRPSIIMKNLWLGVSCERQQEADERIPHLLQTPTVVRFVSAEPLLGPIDLENLKFDGGEKIVNGFCGQHAFRDGDSWEHAGEWPGLDWVIVGGESGPGARPMHPDWARSLRDQCAAAGVPMFFKQWGAHFPVVINHAETLSNWDGPIVDGQPFARVGKKAAGRLLDGQEHNAMPQVSA